jgi:YHS domain-containing protein
MVKDPVCDMMIDEKTAAGRSEYQGHTYYFCSKTCKDEFDRNPDAYVSRGDTRRVPST